MSDRSELEWRKALHSVRRLESRVVELLVADGVWSERERSAHLDSLLADDELEEYEEASRDRSAESLAEEVARGRLEPGHSRFAGLTELAAELRAEVVRAAGLHPRRLADGRQTAEFVRFLEGGAHPRQLWVARAGYFRVDIVRQGRRACYFASAKSGASPLRMIGYVEQYDDSPVSRETIRRALEAVSFELVMWVSYGVTA